MSNNINVIFTERSLRNAQDIMLYLQDNFTDKKIDDFFNLLLDFEKAVSQFPHLYPESKSQKNLRKAVLNKFLSVYYVFDNNEIVVVAMQDNRQANPKD